jgi:ABC-type tungstate transport system substrate-binding protein
MGAMWFWFSIGMFLFWMILLSRNRPFGGFSGILLAHQEMIVGIWILVPGLCAAVNGHVL